MLDYVGTKGKCNRTSKIKPKEKTKKNTIQFKEINQKVLVMKEDL